MSASPGTRVSKRKLVKKKKIAVALIALGAAAALTVGQRKERTMWCRQWLARREEQGCYENLMRELALQDQEGFRRWLRMDTDTFDFLLDKVSPYITKQNTVMREAIPAGLKLSVALRYLATGETQSSLGFQFRIGQNTISTFLPGVCKTLYEVLHEDYLTVPKTTAEWEAVASAYNELWNFPSCIGALDGKHVEISPPPGSGSHYHNYKGDFSIVLLALVDANMKFLYVDVGTNGRISDGGVWAKSRFRGYLEAGKLPLPEGLELPDCGKVPSVLVGDDAFPLQLNIMKPYPGKHLDSRERIFNYRLSRARRVVENAFGVLSARFRVFKSPILLAPEKAIHVVLASCALHNLLTTKNPVPNESLESEDLQLKKIHEGYWKHIQHHLHPWKKSSQTGSHAAKQIRDRFCQYFNGIGKVPWQEEMCLLH